MKYFLFLICVSVFFSVAKFQQPPNWNRLAAFENFQDYFHELVHQTILEVERLGWSNLKLHNITQNVNSTFYDWRAEANATYHDGYLISIQKITLTNIRQGFSTANNSTTGWISGTLVFNDVDLGHDVEVKLPNETRFYTGLYSHNSISFSLRIQKNLNTGEVRDDCSVSGAEAGNFNIRLLPYDRLGQVLGRTFRHGEHWDSAQEWARNIIGPIMRRHASTTVPVPPHCFNC